jgi:hypothetical protein
LFGPERGADSGCWCMFWRLKRSEFHALGKAARKAAFRKLVHDSGGARIDSASGYVGVIEPFLSHGFREVARRTPKRPVVRRYV